MNKNYLNATQQLHKFVSGDSDLSDTEIRDSLKSEGVNIDTFLARLKSEANIPSDLPKAKQPTASERLRALASRAGSGVKNLLDSAVNGEVGTPASAFGRSAKPRATKKKPSRNSKRRK